MVTLKIYIKENHILLAPHYYLLPMTVYFSIEKRMLCSESDISVDFIATE